MDFFVQTKVLLYKECLRDLRSWKTTLLRILLPAISLIFIAFLVNVNLISLFSSGVATGSFGDVPKCTTIRPDGKCVTLLYTIPEGSSAQFNSTVTSIMTNLCDSNPTTLVFGVDVVYYQGVIDAEEFPLRYPNYTYGAVQWTNIIENDTNAEFFYEIFFNATTTQIYNFYGASSEIYIDNFRDTFEAAVERAVTIYLAPQGKTPSITVNVQSYPTVVESLPGTVTWSLADTVIYVFVTIPSLFSAVYLVDEKASGIKGQMRIAGLMDSAYWASVIIEQFFVALISIVIMCSIGKLIPDFIVFHQTSYVVLLIVHMSYQVNCISLACLYSTLFKSKKIANIWVAIVLGVGALVCLTLSVADVFLYFIYYLDFVRKIVEIPLFFIPTYSFGIMLLDIKVVTVGPTFPLYCFTNYEPTEFTFSTFQSMDFVGYYSEYDIVECTSIPPASTSALYLVGTSLIFFLLTLYFDKVLPAHNSIRESIFFLLRPSYWFSPTPKIATHVNPTLALHAHALSKTYRKGILSNSEEITALRPITFEGYTSSVLCLLGPNGAGKSTCISCLTGSIDPSEGDADIFGYSVSSQMHQIKKIMGLCPQFDVLWDDLTAEEHMTIFNGLKRSNERMSKEELKKRLAMVRLHNLPKVVTKSYSGGMKRRLSVVLSTLGDPKIIFLDEPTTGMDPDNRRYVWDLIQQIKAGRLIILTTHSMDEADKLADYVVMIAKGKLRCSGVPIELKTKFGAGYRLSLSIQNEHVEDMKEFMKKALPDAYLRNENAGSLVYALPDTDPDQSMADFFDFLNSKQLSYIKEWGLQNTTLEDVFITVTNKVMGEDIDFTGKSKKANFDITQRDSQQKTLQRYEKRYRKLKNEAQALRALLDEHGIDHRFIADPDADIEYGSRASTMVHNDSKF